MAQERRVHHRAEVVLSLRLVVEGRTVVGTSADISVGGLRVLSPDPSGLSRPASTATDSFGVFGMV